MDLRWPIIIHVGIGSGLGLVASVQGYLLPQISDTLRPLVTIKQLRRLRRRHRTLFLLLFLEEHKGALERGLARRDHLHHGRVRRVIRLHRDGAYLASLSDASTSCSTTGCDHTLSE